MRAWYGVGRLSPGVAARAPADPIDKIVSMGMYSGIATIKADGVRVEVMVHAQSGVDHHSGLGWWRGAFSTTDDGSAFALMQVDEAMIELADENDTGRVLVTHFNLRTGGIAHCEFAGSGALPRSLT